jgi:lysophospholipase L1-like esterase
VGFALANSKSEPAAVSPQVQKYYEEKVKDQPAALPTPEDPLKAKRADDDLSVYFIGDSLTDGWNATEQPKSFRPMVIAGLEKGGHVTAKADYKAGATLSQVAEMAAPPAEADVVILELGTNDVNKTDIGAFGTSLSALVSKLAATKAVLVCVGTWQAGAGTQVIDAQIMGTCQNAGGRFVTISDVRQNPLMVAAKGEPAYPTPADGAHPNNAGHAEIARRVLSRLGA